MAYDAATGTVVLYIGEPPASAHLDTYTWDGSDWTLRDDVAPPFPVRRYAQMAYDPATETVVLFGGDGCFGGCGDTWAFDGSNWIGQSPAASPPARSGGALAFEISTNASRCPGTAPSTRRRLSSRSMPRIRRSRKRTSD